MMASPPAEPAGLEKTLDWDFGLRHVAAVNRKSREDADDAQTRSDRYVRARHMARIIRTLTFYADAENYKNDAFLRRTSPILRDRGKCARQALFVLEDTTRVERESKQQQQDDD